MSEPKPALLVIIPCLNEEHYIGALVNDLIANTKDLSLRIIIADGGSTDNTPKIAKDLEILHSHVHYLHNPERLQSAAVNLAVQTFGDQADYLIRMDAHGEYPAGFCRNLLSEVIRHNADSVVISMDTKGKAGFQKAVAAAQNSKLGNGGSAHRNAEEEGQWVDHGHHALMRIEAFRAIGGYDESFSHNEDAELDVRFQKAGFKIWLTGETNMVYYPRSAPLPLFRQYYKFGQGRIRNIMKHRSRPRLRQMAPVAVAPAVTMLLLAPVHIIFALPFLIWACICLVYGIKLFLNEKEKPIILSGVAIMIMHFAWSLGFWNGLLCGIKDLKS